MTAPVEAIARARGLGTRLQTRARLAELAGAPDLDALARALGASPGVEALERDLRAIRAERLALLARWCGRSPALRDVLFGDEDRRSVVAVLRAAAGGRDPALAGLIPTPDLPEAALTALADQPTPRRVASLLAVWGHPYADALLTAIPVRGVPALAALEAAVHRAWAARAHRAARRGDRVLRDQVRWAIELANLQSLWVGASQPAAARNPDAWLPGGDRLDRATYAATLLQPGSTGLGAALAGGPFAELGAAPDPRLELRALGARVLALIRISREEPLSTAPVLTYALRLRAEAADLRAVVWGVALGRPATEWVTP